MLGVLWQRGSILSGKWHWTFAKNGSKNFIQDYCNRGESGLESAEEKAAVFLNLGDEGEECWALEGAAGQDCYLSMGLVLIILASVWLLLGKLGSHRPSWRQGDLITSQRNDFQVLEKAFLGSWRFTSQRDSRKDLTTASSSKGKALRRGRSGV